MAMEQSEAMTVRSRKSVEPRENKRKTGSGIQPGPWSCEGTAGQPAS